MSAEQVQRPITVEEFMATIPDGAKADLIDGVIHMASPDTPRSDKIGHLIRTLLQGYARRNGGLGEAFGSRVAYAMSRYRSPEPDVSFVLSGRASVIGATRGTGAPDIAVEIVSQESEQRDYIQKRVLYEEAGVREYWIIDPTQGRCTFLRLEDGRFAAVPLDAGRFFRSEVLPGFWLDVEWLFADPLPDEFECLDRVLAGPPVVP
jgi:Uma2 family endonuclease